MSLSLYRLEVFCTVVDEQNMSRASERHSISQPVVSRLVRELEHHYGTPLLVRRGRTVAVTDAGLLVYRYARQLLQSTGETERIVAELVDGDRGVVSIAVTTAIGSYTFPPVWRGFWEAHPHAQLVLQLADSHSVLQHVGHGSVDLALAIAAPVPRGVVVETLGSVEQALVSPADHPHAGSRVSPSQLAGSTFLCTNGTSSFENLARVLGVWGVLDSCRILRFGDTETVKRGVEEGLGIALLMRPAVTRELESGQLSLLSIGGGRIERELLLAQKDAPVSPIVQKFAQFLRRKAQALMGSPG